MAAHLFLIFDYVHLRGMSVGYTQDNTLDFRAIAWTVLIHAILLLVFLFITYQPPALEPIEDMGIEVNLGTAADGYGTDQPMSLGDPSMDNAANTSLSNAAGSDLPADILESNDPDAPGINTSDNNTTADNNNVNSNTRRSNDRPANNTRTQQRARYVYGGNEGPGGNNAPADRDGTSEGNTNGNGDRGVPGGTPGADNYEGAPGSGNGISHNLSGRSIVAFPPKDAEFKEGGRVTIRITVNRLGVIIDKRIVSSGNAELRELALKKVSSIRFNKSNTAPEEQFGNITFVFKTRS